MIARASHRLKTWPEHYRAIIDRSKTFEFRYNDRGIKVGHWLQLDEWDPASRAYTGSCCIVHVRHALRLGDAPGFPAGLVVLDPSDDEQWTIFGIEMVADQTVRHCCHPDFPGSNDCPLCPEDDT